MSLLSQFGGGGGIKSIQRLSVTHPVNGVWPNSVTISAVNTSKTIVLTNNVIGYHNITGAIQSLATASVTLSNSTTLSITGTSVPTFFGAQTYDPILNIQVVEFY